MKLLLDAKLSRHLVARLTDLFPQTEHITNVGLDGATDREVWEYAGRHDCVIVSKDSDFNDLAFMHGHPPKVIWLRVGNAATATVEAVLVNALDTIDAFEANDDDSVLVLTA